MSIYKMNIIIIIQNIGNGKTKNIKHFHYRIKDKVHLSSRGCALLLSPEAKHYTRITLHKRIIQLTKGSCHTTKANAVIIKKLFSYMCKNLTNVIPWHCSNITFSLDINTLKLFIWVYISCLILRHFLIYCIVMILH